MNQGPLIAASVSYGLMLVAYRLPKIRAFHIPVMASCIVFDVAMPLYLVTHRPWWQRLIVQEDLLSFGIWMHFGLLVFMYALEAAQVYSARQILLGNTAARITHHKQGSALLIARALVLATGAILASPTT